MDQGTDGEKWALAHTAYRDAWGRFDEAADLSPRTAALAECLWWLGVLEERLRKHLGEQRYYGARDSSDWGPLLRAIHYARNRAAHDSTAIFFLESEPVDAYTDRYTHRYGVFRWLPADELPEMDEEDARRHPRMVEWHKDYVELLEGKVVIDSIWTAKETLLHLGQEAGLG